MAERAADDVTVIRRNLIRNRVIAMATRAEIPHGQKIPKEMFLAAGWTEEEYAAVPELAKQLPILEMDLR